MKKNYFFPNLTINANHILIKAFSFRNFFFFAADHDKCCSTVRIETTGLSNSTQKARMGLYDRVDTFFDRPVYLHQVTITHFTHFKISL
jgi:hypothetical protein